MYVRYLFSLMLYIIDTYGFGFSLRILYITMQYLVSYYVLKLYSLLYNIVHCL